MYDLSLYCSFRNSTLAYSALSGLSFFTPLPLPPPLVISSPLLKNIRMKTPLSLLSRAIIIPISSKLVFLIIFSPRALALPHDISAHILKLSASSIATPLALIYLSLFVSFLPTEGTLTLSLSQNLYLLRPSLTIVPYLYFLKPLSVMYLIISIASVLKCFLTPNLAFALTVLPNLYITYPLYILLILSVPSSLIYVKLLILYLINL